MQRRLPRIAFVLLGGILTTIGLAWILAAARPRPRDDSTLFSIDRADDTWMGFGQYGPGWRTMTLYGATGLTDAGRDMAVPLPRWVDSHGDGPLEHSAVTTIGAGWPMIALCARRTGVGHDEPPPGSNVWHTGLGPQWVEWSTWRGSLAIDANLQGDRVLPMTFAPLGFAIDSTLFALVWGAIPLMFALRRARRRRGGACTNCGYALRGMTSKCCPECGEPTGGKSSRSI